MSHYADLRQPLSDERRRVQRAVIVAIGSFRAPMPMRWNVPEFSLIDGVQARRAIR